MAKLIVNKHFAEHNNAANGFSTEQKYAFGEIVICNDKENPSIYIKDVDNNSIGIGNVRVINDDKILSKTDGGELQTSIEMVWDDDNSQIKLLGVDKENPISIVKLFSDNGTDGIADKIVETIDRVIDITAVNYDYTDLPNGLIAKQDYIKITTLEGNIENTQYLPYVKTEKEVNILGDSVINVSKDVDGITLSHNKVEVNYTNETEIGFGKGKYVSDVEVNDYGHVTNIKTATLPTPNTTLTKVIDKESNDAQLGWYVSDVKPEGAGLKYKVEYAQLPSTLIYDEDITPEQKEKVTTFVSEIEVEGDTVKYKKSDVKLDKYLTIDEANATFVDTNELEQKLQNMGLTEDGKLPEVAITIDNSNVGEGKYISDIEVNSVDKTHLILKTTDLNLNKYVSTDSVQSKNATLSWGTSVDVASIGNDVISVSLPSKPGVTVSVNENNADSSNYVLVGVSESDTDINELVFSKREFDIDSTLTNKSITPQENVLAWGKSVNVATIGDKDIAVQLPEDIIVIENTSEKSKTQVVTNITIDDNDPTKLKVNYEDLIPKSIVSEETFNNTLKTYLTANDVIINEEETQGVKFVTSITPSKNEDNDLILTLEKENITNVIDDIVSVESNTPVLEWDKETAVAKIGNKEIKVKMPSQPDKADGNTRYKLSGGVEGGEFKITLSEIGENEDDGGSATINFSTDIPEKEIKVIDEGEGKYVTSISTDGDDKHSIIVSREDVDLSGYLKENALDGYAQETWVTQQIADAVTNGTVDLSEYATIQYVDGKFVKTETLNEYVTENELDEKGFITSIPDEYVTESEIEAYNFVKEETLNNYVTKNDIPSIVITGNTDGNTVSNIEVLEDGHTLKLTKTNISLKETDLVINKSGEGEVVTDITNNGHNITITKGNIEHPKTVVNNKAITLTAKEGLQTIAEIDGTPITIQLDPNLTVSGDIPTIKTYVLTGETQGKKTTIKLLDETNNESGSHSIDLSDFSTTSEINSLLTNKNYATQDWVTDKSYATENFVTSQNFLKSNALDAYATQEWVNEQKYLTSIPDEYATQNWVTDTALNGYIKKGDETKYVLSAATENILGGIKVGYQSNDSERMYGVKVDDDGNAYVNIPWVEIKDYLSSNDIVPSNLHYVPTGTSNTYTAEDGKYISGIKYDEKKHITDIVETSLPTVAETAKSLSVDEVGSDTQPVKFVGGKPVMVAKPFLTGISSNDVVTALGYTPLSAETKYNGSTFIKVDSNTISAITGDTKNTLAVGNHNHNGIYQPIGEYVKNSDLNTLTFESGEFVSTSFKANETCTVKVPTHTSHITNDSGFINSDSLIGYATEDWVKQNYLPSQYTTHMYLGSSTATSDATTDVTNPYIRLFDDTTAREDIQVVGQNNLTVKGKNGVITIDGTHTHSQYQAKGNYKTTQTAVSDPTANGNALAFIDTISQDTNGVITVTKKNVRSATTGNTGISKLITGTITDKTYADGEAAAASHNHDGAYLKSYTEAYQGTLTGITVTGASGLTGTGTISAATGSTDGTITLGHALKTVTVSTGATTLAHEGTFVVPIVTYDEYGHISGVTNTTYTLPSDSNTKNSAGAGQAITKLYLVGTLTQSSAGTISFSNSSVYMQNGVLTTSGLEVNGNINLTGTVSGATGYYQTSDEKLKTFGEDIEIDFNKLKEIPKKYFTWNDGRKNGNDLGTSAQVIREIYPELIGGDDDTTLSVDYAKLSIIALKAVDKLHEENEMLKEELEMIKKHLGL